MTLKAGATKVSMNSAAVKDPELWRGPRKFGRRPSAWHRWSPEPLPSVRVRVVWPGNQRDGAGLRGVGRRCQELGAGVILPTSMDGDGTLAGYDLVFTRLVADAVDLPVIASGGAGTWSISTKGDGRRRRHPPGRLGVSLPLTLYRQVKKYLKGRGFLFWGLRGEHPTCPLEPLRQSRVSPSIRICSLQALFSMSLGV